MKTTNFDKITETPETLTEFLNRLLRKVFNGEESHEMNSKFIEWLKAEANE